MQIQKSVSYSIASSFRSAAAASRRSSNYPLWRRGQQCGEALSGEGGARSGAALRRSTAAVTLLALAWLVAPMSPLDVNA